MARPVDMEKPEWPEQWPDIRQVPYAKWPAAMLAIDEEMKKLGRIKVPDQIPKAMARLHAVLAAHGKTMKDLHALLYVWVHPYWREPLRHIRDLAGTELKYWPGGLDGLS